MEKLNYDVVGTLCGYEAGRGPVRAALEYDFRWVRVYHEAFDAAIEALPVDLDEQPAPPRYLVARLLIGYWLRNEIHRHIRHANQHPAEIPGGARGR
jgi:hypothetical protein